VISGENRNSPDFRQLPVAAFYLTIEYSPWIDRDLAECGLDAHFILGQVIMENPGQNGSEIVRGPKGSVALRRLGACECGPSDQADERRLQIW
jgi:hypothetical protein